MASRLSVCLISHNEEGRIERTLAAVAELAAEIVVIDSGSTDRTVEIARAAGAKVFHEPWPGYAAQKNRALALCGEKWILSLDCDEVPTPELVAAIRAVLARPDGDGGDGGPVGYTINRRTVYLGRVLRRTWYPDRKLRLVRRDAGAVWKGLGATGIHESLTVAGPRADLPGDCLHYSYRDFADHMARMVRYTREVARDYHGRGRRVGRLGMLARPPLAFVKEYFFRGAFVDGMPGFLAAWSKAAYIYMKFGFLWELNAAADPTPPSNNPNVPDVPDVNTGK